MIKMRVFDLSLSEALAQDSKPHPGQRLGDIDPLTRVYTRAFFEQQLALQWRAAVRRGEPLTLFLLDIDQFGAYVAASDSRSGDYALQKIAKTLALLFRRATDFIARYEDDQFAVLAADMAPEQARAHALRIRDRVQSLRLTDRQSGGTLTVSVGYVAHQPRPEEDAQAMVAAASRNLLQAKATGRNEVFGT